MGDALGVKIVNTAAFLRVLDTVTG